jgi:hypothetical protein
MKNFVHYLRVTTTLTGHLAALMIGSALLLDSDALASQPNDNRCVKEGKVILFGGYVCTCEEVSHQTGHGYWSCEAPGPAPGPAIAPAPAPDPGPAVGPAPDPGRSY